MNPTTVLRLALAGTRTDTLRVLLTGLSAVLATLAILAALTVLAIPTPLAPGDGGSAQWSQQYTNALLREPGLRPGVAFALILVAVPVLALAGQCARLGAPARDRRLAAIRLAGATPGQAVLVVAAETGLASALGGLTGLVLFLAGRQVAHRPRPDGRLLLPTDVLPSTGALLAVCLGLPVVAALVGALLVRRVTISPLGVSRRAPRAGGPRPWPALLIVVGAAAFLGLGPLLTWLADNNVVVPDGAVTLGLTVGVLAAAAGIVLGTGWLSYATGRLLHRLTHRPAVLLAARRLIADPWHGSRTLAAVLACVLVGGGAAGLRAYFAAIEAARAEAQRQYQAVRGEPLDLGLADTFFTDSMNLVNLAVAVALLIAAGGLGVAVAEAVVSRRRTYAALIATGVPRGVVARSVVWQAMAPAVPAVVLAGLLGLALSRGLHESTVTEGGSTLCTADAAVCDDPVAGAPYLLTLPPVVRTVALPVLDLTVLWAGALAAVLIAVGVGLLFLRPSTDLAELRVG